MDISIQGAAAPFSGEITIPGDKSISHRAIMLGALSEGTTRVTGFLNGADCLSTIRCFRDMGIAITLSDDETEVQIEGRGLHGLQKPEHILNCGNSGTTTRLISGILSAQNFDSCVTGDESIQKRPMNRIIKPLREMSASIRTQKDNGCAPLEIHGQSLHGIDYESPVASAQVKSAILFAGLYASQPVRIMEPYLSRDHSERMLRALGATVSTKTLADGRAEITLQPGAQLIAPAATLEIPGDISSAAYFISAALLVPGSDLLIRNVGINPTRAGILEVYRRMGANISLVNQRLAGAEEVADLHVCYTETLRAVDIGGALIPTLIDELPVIAAVAAAAEGDSRIYDAAELKVKESNRIQTMVAGLSSLGISAEETEDGMIIHGQGKKLRLCSASIDSFKDHRIAMTFAVLALRGTRDTTVTIHDAECIEISYPNFFKDMKKMIDKE